MQWFTANFCLLELDLFAAVKQSESLTVGLKAHNEVFKVLSNETWKESLLLRLFMSFCCLCAECKMGDWLGQNNSCWSLHCNFEAIWPASKGTWRGGVAFMKAWR